MKKLLVAGMMVVMASSVNAWMYDGDNYIGLNAHYGSGKIDSESISSQTIGIEMGRNFSPNWYGAFLTEYATYDISQSNIIDEKGLNGFNIAGKLGYRPSKHTLVYGTIGVALQDESNGVLFGGGFRWNIFNNAGFFIEGRRQSVTSNDKNYNATYGLLGINLFLNY